ncbi:MAG: hypothetical protein ACE1ZF_02970 [Gemmatimonadales bacterium]
MSRVKALPNPYRKSKPACVPIDEPSKNGFPTLLGPVCRSTREYGRTSIRREPRGSRSPSSRPNTLTFPWRKRDSREKYVRSLLATRLRLKLTPQD